MPGGSRPARTAIPPSTPEESCDRCTDAAPTRGGQEKPPRSSTETVAMLHHQLLSFRELQLIGLRKSSSQPLHQLGKPCWAHRVPLLVLASLVPACGYFWFFAVRGGGPFLSSFRGGQPASAAKYDGSERFCPLARFFHRNISWTRNESIAFRKRRGLRASRVTNSPEPIFSAHPLDRRRLFRSHGG